MRRRSATYFSIFFLLTLTLFPPRTDPATLAGEEGIVVEEVEPNDAPKTAQEIPFPRPGEKVVFHGRVARGDRGERSEELEAFFNRLDFEVGEIHDWIVADPDSLEGTPLGDGPIPLRITADWGPVTPSAHAQQEADLDFWVGTQVDDQTFFIDGFKALSDIQMATERRPESWPRSDQSSRSVVLYLQPRGVRTAEGEQLPNDGFGRRLMIGIQHYSGPPAAYTVTIENLAPASFAGLESHQIDDGLLSAQFFAGPAGAIVVNRFRPSQYPARLVAIGHPFLAFRDGPDPTGRSLRVLVLKGESDRPDATPPRLDDPTKVLLDKMLPIPSTIERIGDVVDISLDPPLTIESGVVYVGFQFPSESFEQTGIALAFDRSPVQFLRTYISRDGGQTWGRPTREEPFTGLTVFMNAEIRATFAVGDAQVTTSRIVRAFERAPNLRTSRPARTGDLPRLSQEALVMR